MKRIQIEIDMCPTVIMASGRFVIISSQKESSLIDTLDKSLHIVTRDKSNFTLGADGTPVRMDKHAHEFRITNIITGALVGTIPRDCGHLAYDLERYPVYISKNRTHVYQIFWDKVMMANFNFHQFEYQVDYIDVTKRLVVGANHIFYKDHLYATSIEPLNTNLFMVSKKEDGSANKYSIFSFESLEAYLKGDMNGCLYEITATRHSTLRTGVVFMTDIGKETLFTLFEPIHMHFREMRVPTTWKPLFSGNFFMIESPTELLIYDIIGQIRTLLKDIKIENIQMCDSPEASFLTQSSPNTYVYWFP